MRWEPETGRREKRSVLCREAKRMYICVHARKQSRAEQRI